MVRFTTKDGEQHNIEATNGGLRGNNAPYVDNMPITPEAVANRVFLATLTNEEAVAVIAVVVLEYLIKEKRYHGTMAVADTLLDHYEAFGYAMVKNGTAAYNLLKTNFHDKYATAQVCIDIHRTNNRFHMLSILQKTPMATTVLLDLLACGDSRLRTSVDQRRVISWKK